MILTCYAICAFLTISDEIWNIRHPRRYSFKSYNVLQWDDKDFYSVKIDGEWVLRPYRKVDSPFKRHIRKKYWKKRKKDLHN